MATKKSIPLATTKLLWDQARVIDSPALEDDTPAAAEPASQSSAMRRALGDTGLSLLKGAIAVPEAAVGIADLVTGGTAGRMAEAAGFRPREARAMLDEYLSPEQQAANLEVQQAEGFLGKLAAAARNPSVVGHTVLESLPAMGAGGVVARGLMATVPRMSAVAAGAAGEGVVSAGQSAEQVRQESPDGELTAKQSLIAGTSGAATGVIGLIGGKVAQRLGIGDVDTMLAQASRATGADALTAERVTKGFVRRVLEGAFSEGVLEELPQSIQEQVAQNAATGQPLDKDVDYAAVLGLLSGAAMGGGAASIGTPGAPPRAGDELRATGLQPEVGPMTRALNTAVETAAKRADAGEPIPVEPGAEPVAPPAPVDFQAAEAAMAQEEAAQAAEAAPMAQPGLDDDAARAQREADRPAEPTGQVQAGDILNKQGQPFKNMTSARRALTAAGDGHELVRVADGLVVRPVAGAEQNAAAPDDPGRGDGVGPERTDRAPEAAAPEMQLSDSDSAQPVEPAVAVPAPRDAGGDGKGAQGEGAAELPMGQEPGGEARVVKVGGKEYSLTPEQRSELEQVESDFKGRFDKAKADFERAGKASKPDDPDVGYRNPKEQYEAAKKALGMQLSAERRRIVGALTPKEQQAKDDQAARVRAGDMVATPDGDGEVTGLAFGKVRVKLGSGETKAYPRSEVQKTDAAAPQQAVEATGREAPAPAAAPAAEPITNAAGAGTAEVEAGGVKTEVAEQATATPVAESQAPGRAADGEGAAARTQAGSGPAPETVMGMTEEQRRAAIDTETMESRQDAPEVAQPTKGRRVKVFARTLNGVNQVVANLYELPGYKGPQLAVKEYKTSRGQGYRVYLPKSGAFIADSNGVSSLEDTLKLAVLRIQNAQDTIRKKQPATQAESAAPAKPKADAAVSSVDGQKNLASRGSRIASLMLMNEQIKKLDPTEAWHPDNINDSTDLDGLQDSISSTLVRLQREKAAKNAEPSHAEPIAPHQDPGEPAEPATEPKSLPQLIADYKAAKERERALADAKNVNLSELARAVDATRDARAPLVAMLAEQPALSAVNGNGLRRIVAGSAQKPGQWQLTRFDQNGEPWGDSQYTSQAEAIDDFLREVDIDTLETSAPAPAAAPEQANTRDRFTLQRLNRDTDKMEPVSFERGEYVRVTFVGSGGETFGEIDGISQARREFSVDGLWHPFGAAYKAERPSAPKKDAVPMSKVIDKVNAKNGDGLTTADAVSPLQAFKDTINAVYDGTADIEVYQAAYRRVRDAQAVKAELGKMTKDELIRDFGIMARPGEKKDSLVSSAYESMLRSFALGKSYGPNSYMMTSGGYENYLKLKAEALDELVAGQTADDLAAYAAEVKKSREERAAKRAETVQAIENPQTLDDYARFLEFHQREGKTSLQARLLLPVERRAALDELAATKTRTARKDTKDEQRAVRVAGQVVDGQIIETKHTKKGHDLFVVRLAERVSREDYETLNAGAKKIGGYYSSYRGGGAIPGFQFTTRAQAEAFTQLAGGNADQAQEAAAARRDAFEDDRSQTAVERLTEMADRLEERADESLGRDRKANTDRRARQAASAEASARSDKSLARTMRNIAAKIESGTAKFLDRVRQKVQVEMLRAMATTAQNDQLRAKYPSYADFEKHQGDPFDAETADFVEFPEYTAYRSDLASLGRQLLDVDGTKQLGQRLMKVADDVSDAFKEFAKEPGNLFKLSTFSLRRGEEVKTAIFPSQDGAERAIKRSGLVGKAIVFQEKRGVNRIIMSPSEAINAGIWKGDGDKRITLSDSFGAELVEKIGRANRRGSRVSVPWQFERAYDRRKALARLGIEKPHELRAAMREFIDAFSHAEAPSKVKQLERAMIGRRNDGLDFFPTPEGVADEMVAAADIQPGMRVLEPSAGWGHIAERIRDAGVEPEVVEYSNDRRELLEAKGFNVIGTDFMHLSTAANGEFDRILMNPPFSEGRDIQHVRHAYSLLKPGGRLVAIMGEGAFTNSLKRAQEFREWLEQVGGTEEKLAEGTFNDPSLPVNTSVNARMVVIEKGEGESVKFSLSDDAPPFYSELARQVEASRMNAAPAGGWKQWLRGLVSKGVKPDEIAWTGIEEWLDLQQGKVTKQAMADYLDANGVRVTETVLGEPESAAETLTDKLEPFGITVETDPYDDGLIYVGEDGDAIDYDELPREARDIVDQVSQGVGGNIAGATKYSQYTLPGGTNYREVLLTLPSVPRNDRPQPLDALPVGYEVIFDSQEPQGQQWGITEPGQMHARPWAGRHADPDAARAAALKKLNDEAMARWRDAAPEYKSGHWDQPNILAHVRLNDRTDAEGKRVLFVEEIQSDWAQAARKSQPGEAPNRFSVRDVNGNIRGDFATAEEADAYLRNPPEHMRQFFEQRMGGEAARVVETAAPPIDKVPAAPFVDATDKWVALALKRVIKMAVDEGYDRVAFVTGEQSAARYDLSKQVDAIRLDGDWDQSIEVSAAKPGQGFEHITSTTKDKLAEVIGKELAAKALETGQREFNGLDLKVGGEGMRAFYDKIVPSVLKDVLRKVGGGAPTTVQVLGQAKPKSLSDFGSYDDFKAAKVESPTLTQTGFDITPAMREKAAGGLPLFGRGTQGASGNAARLQSLVDAVSANWENAPPITVVNDLQDAKVPQEVRDEDAKQRKAGATGTPEGLYYKGRVYLIAGQLPGARDALRVLFHETLGHHGLRNAFGRELGSILDRLALANPGKVRAKAKQYGLDFDNARERRQAAEEVLAEMAQTNPQIGWARQAIAAIRSFLRRVVPGFQSMQFSDDEIVRNFIIPARNWVKGGEDVTFQRQPAPAFGRDVSMSRGAIDALRSFTTSKNVAQAFDDLTRSQESFNWWHRTVGTQFHKARVNPDFAKVYDTAQEYLHDTSAFANDPADLAPDVLPQLNTLADMRKQLTMKEADRKAVAAAVFGGTLYYTRDDSGRVRPANDDETAGVVFTPDELKTMFKMDDRQIAMYQQFRRATDRSLDILAASDVARMLGDGLPAPLRAMISQGDTGRFKGLVTAWAKQQRQEADDALAEVRKRHRNEMSSFWRKQKKEMEGPRGRAGARLALLEELDAEKRALKLRHGGERYRAEQAFSKWDALEREVRGKYERIDELKAAGYAPLMRFGRYTVDVVGQDGSRKFFGMFESQREANAAARQHRETAEEGDQVTQGILSEQAYRQFSGLTPETIELFAEVAGVEKTALFEEYLRRAKSNRSAMKRLIRRTGVAGFSEDPSRVLASFLTSNARASASSMHLGALAQAVEDVPKEAGDVKDEAIKLREYVQNPQEEAQALRGLLFMQYLGGSVASAMVNMTQPVLMTLPYLAQFGGLSKAAARLTSAINVALGKVAPSSDLGRALALAEKEGIVSPQELHQLQAESSRTLGNNPMARRLVFLWGGFFSLAEQFNRRVSFVAAYQTAKAEGKANPFEFAARAVDETQGVYNKGNRPNWARGAIGATVFTFKQYSISYMEFLARLPKRERAIALAILVLASGAGGLPGADDLDDLIDTLGQNLGYDTNAKLWKARVLTQALGEQAADLVLNGFSALPGMPLDVSARLGLGNLIPGTGMLLKSTTDKSREVAEAVGPIGSTVVNAVKALPNVLNGEFGKAVAGTSPVAIKNLAKALEMYQTGEYRDTLGRKVQDVSMGDAVVKGIGFQPAAVARSSERIRMAQQQVALARNIEAEIAAQWAQGIADGRPDQVAAARDRLVAWNKANPATRIAITRAQLVRRVQQIKMPRDQRFLKATPKEMRGAVKEMVS